MLSQEQKQYILAEAYTHCVRQGQKAQDALGGCVYVNSAGHRCAIGAGMSAPTLKRFRNADVSVRVLYGRGLRVLFGCAFDRTDLLFLREVQDAHDTALVAMKGAPNFAASFGEAAKRFGLKLDQ